MKNNILILISMFFIMSCGSQPESDQVAIASKDFQYIFNLNPSYQVDTNIKKFIATLYLHSDLPGHTQFTIKLDGTQIGKTYKVNLYDRDSSKPYLINENPRIGFQPITAIDTTELAYTSLIVWDMDSIINNYNGYLTVVSSDQDSLLDKNFLIKGQIGK